MHSASGLLIFAVSCLGQSSRYSQIEDYARQSLGISEPVDQYKDRQADTKAQTACELVGFMSYRFPPPSQPTAKGYDEALEARSDR